MAQYTLHFAEDALVLEAPLLRGSSSVLRVSLEPDSLKPHVALEARSAALEQSASRTMSVFAILGIVELFRGPYLAVVTRARAVVRNGPGGAEICQVVAADFFPVPKPSSAAPSAPLSPLQHRLEAKFLDMLHSVVDTRTLYYSHNYDITQTAQRIALLGQRLAPRTPEFKLDGGGFWEAPRHPDGKPIFTNEQSLASRADPRFFWNLNMSHAFAAARLDDWVHPVICGYVAVRHNVPIEVDGPSALSLTYLFISRRSRTRQGTRFNLRGLDAEGNAANFVETEQILLPQAGEVVDPNAVVQTVLSRRHVLASLEALAVDESRQGRLPHKADSFQDDVMCMPYAAMEFALQEVNRSNANTMSVLYAGTPALKTRRGKLGKLQDGLNSVTRYFINNFSDANKQDAINLFLGDFSVSSLGKTEDVFARDAGDETLASVFFKLVFVFLAVFMLGAVFGTTSPSANFTAATLTTMVLILSVAAHALRKGLSPAFVSKPRFIRADL
ncbi:Phosphatidylinositide phosphatase SAC1 [Hondaea fermentalgiana]|uniref:Phosphatidylinositide phosphatase SAC1 n=1 Tax=Hondaea fermentalgiana TaxID=2315210 RepID=A0A2R5GI54_9STRA|nr:Phosphatidylinositide phosphatase SAC1 [Hondaea fermentalgiana]|eukprot:GBG29408.1 Phosphatidylinositide phosphatase SAC1 [Hondaea fermentalgiana]